MTDQVADLTEAFGFNPFNSTDPHIKFLIASIVTAAVLLTGIDVDLADSEQDKATLARYDELIAALILAANALRVATSERIEAEG
jgi:hypothetical protein